MRFAFHIIGLVLTPLLISACSTQACYDDTDPMVNIGLFASGAGTVKKSTSLNVTGVADPSSVQIFSATTVASFSVPLDPVHNTSVFIITLNGVADTAIINYTSFIHIVSPECGYTFYNEITGLRTTHNIIDSLNIENKSVTLNGERNLRLFY